jgi:hypothetical protein
MTYPPPGPGYPDGGYEPQQYPQQQPGWTAPDPAAGQQDPYAYGAQPYAQQPVSGAYGQPPVSVTPISGPHGYDNPMLGMPAAPQPPAASNTPLITTLVVGAVALLGLGAVLVFTLGGTDDDGSDNAASGASQSASESASPSPDEASASPTEADDGIADLSYAEFDDDWKDSAGDASATYVNGWDYTGCTKFEDGSSLTDRGCEYGVEVAYEAEDGEMKLANIFMGMTDADAASDAVTDMKDGEFVLREDGYIYDFEYGMWQADSVDNIVIITVVTGTKKIDDSTGDEYLEAMNADMTAMISDR